VPNCCGRGIPCDGNPVGHFKFCSFKDYCSTHENLILIASKTKKVVSQEASWYWAAHGPCATSAPSTMNWRISIRCRMIHPKYLLLNSLPLKCTRVESRDSKKILPGGPVWGGQHRKIPSRSPWSRQPPGRLRDWTWWCCSQLPVAIFYDSAEVLLYVPSAFSCSGKPVGCGSSRAVHFIFHIKLDLCPLHPSLFYYLWCISFHGRDNRILTVQWTETDSFRQPY